MGFGDGREWTAPVRMQSVAHLLDDAAMVPQIDAAVQAVAAVIPLLQQIAETAQDALAESVTDRTATKARVSALEEAVAALQARMDAWPDPPS